MTEYGEQIATITYGDRAFVAWHVSYERARGNIVVYRDGHATVHKRVVPTKKN